MKTLKYVLVPIYILIFSFVVIPKATAQQKYAILISAGNTTIDDQAYHSEYWYDLFLMYRMLIESGFTHNNIFVLYGNGNGNDFNSSHANYQTATVFPGIGQITDFPVSKANVQNIFTWLANGNAAQGIPQIQPGDFLFYWWMGHGGGCNCNNYSAGIESTNENVSENEFAAYFAQLPACVIKTQYVMTCRSGGLIDNLAGLHTTLHTAAECCTDSHSQNYDVVHAELSYHAANAFRQQEPSGAVVASDISGDGLVSVREANNYVHSHTAQSNTQIGDYRNIAPLINIVDAQPASLVPNQGVYSRDYAEDSGTEPSEYMSYIWYEGPDLWVRHAADGDTIHQDPEFGQTNYVYARLHNIDCNSVNVTANLSWAEISAWSNPSSWNPIATVNVNNLQSNETRVVSAPWTTVPAPGKYCMHTVLNALGDSANADGRSYMDNNKVQINVTVADTFWGLKKNFHWFIENGLNKKTKVDLVIDKIEFPLSAKLELRIPPDLKFARLIGGDVERSTEGSIIKISPKAKKVIVQGMVLAASVKKEAILSMITPKEMKLGETLIVKVSEQIDGKEMGGIIFNAKTTNQEKVLAGIFRNLGNFFKMLDKKFDIDSAREASKSFEDIERSCRFDDSGNLDRALSEVISIETKLKEILPKHHMKKQDLIKFNAALNTSKKAVESKNIGLFIESQEEMMLSTKPLFLQKMAEKS